jgi:hypothetical protein
MRSWKQFSRGFPGAVGRRRHRRRSPTSQWRPRHDPRPAGVANLLLGAARRTRAEIVVRVAGGGHRYAPSPVPEWIQQNANLRDTRRGDHAVAAPHLTQFDEHREESEITTATVPRIAPLRLTAPRKTITSIGKHSRPELPSLNSRKFSELELSAKPEIGSRIRSIGWGFRSRRDLTPLGESG